MPAVKRAVKPVFIIAEAGVNHNGQLDLAMDLIALAKDAGADAVKFQTFKSEAVISRFAPKAEYQKKTTGAKESQLEMVKKLEFAPSVFQRLSDRCRREGILFLSTPFDLGSVDVLADLKVPIFKIPSGEITNMPYLRKIGALRRKVILSTGMSTFKEIRTALDILTKAGTQLSQLTLLHCNSEYPTPFEDANLLAMVAMRKEFNLPVGYSDHTLGIDVAIAAVALGASVIEKHFTLDKSLPGPDHTASLSPQELRDLVAGVRHVEAALGNGIKRPSPSEAKNMAIARKSIVAARPIRKGQVLSEENLTVKRPGSGISPLLWDRMLGRKAKRDFQEDELMEM